MIKEQNKHNELSAELRENLSENHKSSFSLSGDHVALTVQHVNVTEQVDGTRVIFSAHQCFTFDSGPDDIRCLQALGGHLKKQPGLAIYGTGRLFDYLLLHLPDLKKSIRYVLTDSPKSAIQGIPSLSVQKLSADIKTVFLCEPLTVQRHYMRKRIPAHIQVIEPDILLDIAREVIPSKAWSPTQKNIYPLDLPEIKFKQGMDLILLDCPARNLALMPNGIGYVHNALKKASVTFQTFDLDIVAYHQFHIRRLYDEGGIITLKNGKKLPEDPWKAQHYDFWQEPDVLDYFTPVIAETVTALVAAKPKILGLSIHQCNREFSRKLVNAVKTALPQTVILVGGYDCYNPETSLRRFPECDYMCIGESDLTVGPLVEKLAGGERPNNLPGIISRHDTPERVFEPAPMEENIDSIEFPKYEWFDLSLYRNFNGYQLTPIIASRGCLWSRCTFCAERFYWRIRSAKNFADEMEWLVDRGCTLFMFNESDLNGMPERLLDICDEIIRRKLGVKLTGQLRIHKKSDRRFFDKLRAAGFVTLRFGVDAFSKNTLRRQMKGYTVDMISQNLKDCWEAGIVTEVNWVIGVPGETDEDIQEGLDLILKNRKYIGRLENINPLILTSGSVYWEDPAKHNIVFRKPLQEALSSNGAVPADLWYSTDPYIDAEVRKKRFDLIAKTLYESGFPVGAWAAHIIDDVKMSKDRYRVGRICNNEDSSSNSKGDSMTPAPVPKVTSPTTNAKIVSLAGSYYAIKNAFQHNSVSRNSNVKAIKATTKGANPQSARIMGRYHIVSFDGAYYGVPIGLDIDWDFDDLDSLPDSFKGASAKEVADQIDSAKKNTNLDSPEVTACEANDIDTLGMKTPFLIEVDYHGFNIFRCKGRYFTVSQSLGNLDLLQTEQKNLIESQKLFISDTMPEAREWVDSRGGGLIEIAETGYSGFNILRFRGMYHALSQSIKMANLRRTEESLLEEYRKNFEFFVGNTLLETKEWIDRLGMGGMEMVERNYNGFNILRFRRKYYAITQSLADLDLAETEESYLLNLKKENELFISSALPKLKEWIDQFGLGGAELIEIGYNGFNILRFKRKYYAVSQSLGDLNLYKSEESLLNNHIKDHVIYIGNTQQKIKEWLDRPIRKFERLKRAVQRRLFLRWGKVKNI